MTVSNNNTSSSKTLGKALIMLNAFTNEKLEWGVRSLADYLSISPSIAHRILKTLTDFNYLAQDQVRKKYTLGPEILRLASAYYQNNPLQMIASEVFHKHTKEWPYDLYMGSLSGYEVAYSAIVSGSSRIKIEIHAGERTALFSTALGKVLLAYQSEEFQKEYFKKVVFTQFTSKTITNPEQLINQLHEIRIKGYAVNEGEQYEKIGSLGAPVFNYEQRIAASVCLTYPMFENDSLLNQHEKLVTLVKTVAQEITSRYSGL